MESKWRPQSLHMECYMLGFLELGTANQFTFWSRRNHTQHGLHRNVLKLEPPTYDPYRAMNIQDSYWLSQRAILAPLNDMVCRANAVLMTADFDDDCSTHNILFSGLYHYRKRWDTLPCWIPQLSLNYGLSPHILTVKIMWNAYYGASRNQSTETDERNQVCGYTKLCQILLKSKFHAGLANMENT